MSVAQGPDERVSAAVGVIASERMWDVIERGSRDQGAMDRGWTYSGHPVRGGGVDESRLSSSASSSLNNAAQVGAGFRARLHEGVRRASAVPAIAQRRGARSPRSN